MSRGETRRTQRNITKRLKPDRPPRTSYYRTCTSTGFCAVLGPSSRQLNSDATNSNKHTSSREAEGMAHALLCFALNFVIFFFSSRHVRELANNVEGGLRSAQQLRLLRHLLQLLRIGVEPPGDDLSHLRWVFTVRPHPVLQDKRHVPLLLARNAS